MTPVMLDLTSIEEDEVAEDAIVIGIDDFQPTEKASEVTYLSRIYLLFITAQHIHL